MATPAIEDTIEHARHGLDDKLTEIERRISSARHALSLEHILASPWARLGASVVAGFALGVAGRNAVRTGVNLALGVGARRIMRAVFDAAFEQGISDAHTASASLPDR